MLNLYAMTVVTAPAFEPVTRAEAKFQCAIESAESYWDADLSRLIAAARDLIESRTNRSIVGQTLKLVLPRFPGCDPIRLPRGPARSVTSIQYVDPAGATQTWSSAEYLVATSGMPGLILPKTGFTWPSIQPSHPEAVLVTYTAGPATAAAVVPTAKHLTLLLVAHWFRNREAVTDVTANELPMAAEILFKQLDAGDEFEQYGAEL